MNFASAVLMIRPDSFQFNEQTAGSNFFQQEAEQTGYKTQRAALAESYNLRDQLINAGINVFYFYETEDAETPDAVFPNNWFSTHSNGKLVLYSMQAPNRRSECNENIIDFLKSTIAVSEVLDLRCFENEKRFLEGTGSLVFNHTSKTVYAVISERTDANLVQKVGDFVNYTPIIFNAVDQNNLPIYHTNVMMSIGNNFVLICLESIKNREQREQVMNTFSVPQLEIIELTLEQMNHFACNSLQLINKKQEPVLVMSTQGYFSLRKEQIQQIEKHSAIIHSDLSTIETVGGGSARCMLAELFK
jgi:hypothetical protein